MRKRDLSEPPALRNICQKDNPESVERYHIVKAALLIIRNECSRQQRTMPEFLDELGLVTLDDLRTQDEVEKYELYSEIDARDTRRVLRRLAYPRELLRTYRPALYRKLMEAPSVRKVA